MAEKTDRRCFLARGVIGAAGIGAAHGSLEENILAAAIQDGSAQPSPAEKPKTDIPAGSLPCGMIGNIAISRLLIGGNLIGGFAHSRDLMYALETVHDFTIPRRKFSRPWNLPKRAASTPSQLDPRCWESVSKYNQRRAAKIQTMVCIPLFAEKVKMNEEIRRQVDRGATLLYSHGGVTDGHVMNGGQTDVIGQMVDSIKAQGLPAGVGGHSLNIPIACEKDNINPDFYVKTFHSDRYWSATPNARRKEYDWLNMDSSDPRCELR